MGKKINHLKSGWFRFTAVGGVNNTIAAHLPAAGDEKFCFAQRDAPTSGAGAALGNNIEF